MKPNESVVRTALPVGTILRGYAIESVLGHGGFGVVYLARHVELDSLVALKEYLPTEFSVRDAGTVHPRSSDCADHYEDGLRRFSEEAQQLIQFRHDPSVVACLDLFSANGTAYLVMEYVEGMTLAELLRRREAKGSPLIEGELRALAVPLLEGLCRVHAAGVLHRDITPSNILIRRDDEQPVLIDFGSAKQDVALNTKSFAHLTAGYAAMEQVGEGELGTWTDMYGVGAVLWRVIASGNPPWRPPNPLKVESRLNAVVRGRRDPMPSALEIGDGRFSNALLSAVDKCLALRESDRLPSCDVLLKVILSQHRATDNPKHSPDSGETSSEHILRYREYNLIRTPQKLGSFSLKILSYILKIGKISVAVIVVGSVWIFFGIGVTFYTYYELLPLLLESQLSKVSKDEIWGWSILLFCTFSVMLLPPIMLLNLLNSPSLIKSFLGGILMLFGGSMILFAMYSGQIYATSLGIIPSLFGLMIYKGCLN